MRTCQRFQLHSSNDPPSDLHIGELIQIQLPQIVFLAKVLRVREDDDRADQVDADELGHISLHIGVTHIGAVVDGVQIRHHAGIIAVVIPCLGRVDMKIPQLPAKALRREPLKRVLFPKPPYLVRTLLLDLFDGMIAVFANGLLTDGHAMLLAVSLIHLTEVLPVLLIVFLCPEPPALELFKGEFFSFHGKKSS